ncbi:MAG: ABC transporter substrate-binding protein [Acidimicrobiales bacterium]
MSVPDECTQDRVGGSATVGTYSQPLGLDPVAGSGLSTGKSGGIEGAALYDTLTRWNDATSAYVPQLAQSITANSDFTVWTLKLRPGVTYGNGKTMRSADVKFSIDRHVAPESKATLKNVLLIIDRMELPDDLTVVFTLKQGWSGFPYVLSGSPGMIADPAVVAARAADFTKNPAGAGAGPYEFTKFTPNEEIVLQAKTNYWGGPVCIQQLRFVTLAGAQPTFDAMTTGTLQIGFLADAEVSDAAKAKGYKGLSYILSASASLMLNHRAGAPTADVKVRTAIQRALDPKVIMDRQFNGHGLPTTALVHPDLALAPKVAGPTIDLAEAKRLVTEAKASGWNGKIRLLCNDPPDRQRAALAVETLLTSIGMTVETTIVTTNELIARVITRKDFDTACWALNLSTDELYYSLSTYDSKNTTTNYPGLQSPQMDEAVKKLLGAATADDKRTVLGEIQTIWTQTVPVVIWGGLESYIAFDASVHGLKKSARESFLFDKAYIKR